MQKLYPKKDMEAQYIKQGYYHSLKLVKHFC